MRSLLVICAVVLAGNSVSAEPKIESVGPAEVDFGRYNAWEPKTASYRIRNSGDSMLDVINVQRTCGCAEARCSKAKLNPGEDAVVEVKVIPNSIIGRYAKATYVESNDRNNPYLQLIMRGEAVPLVDVKPSEYYYAGRVEKGEEWKQSFEFMMNQPGVKLGDPIITNSHPVNVKCAKAANGGVTGCEVRLFPLLSDTDFEMMLSFPVLEPEGHLPVNIGVCGKAGRELVAVPGTMRFGFSKEPVKRKFFLKVMGGDGVAVTSSKLTVPSLPGVTFTLKDDNVKGSVEVDAVFAPEFTSRVISESKVEFFFKMDGVAAARVVCRSMEEERKAEDRGR